MWIQWSGAEAEADTENGSTMPRVAGADNDIGEGSEDNVDTKPNHNFKVKLIKPFGGGTS